MMAPIIKIMEVHISYEVRVLRTQCGRRAKTPWERTLRYSREFSPEAAHIIWGFTVRQTKYSAIYI